MNVATEDEYKPLTQDENENSKPMNAATEDEYKLLTQDEHEKLFRALDEITPTLNDIKSALESLSKSTEELLPDTNESPQANNDLPERIEQQVEQFNSSVKEAYNLSNQIDEQIGKFNTAIENSLKSIDGKIQELNRAAENFSETIKTTDELQQTLEQFTAQKNPWEEMFDKFATNVQTFKETTERQNTVELEQLKKQRDDFKSERDSARDELRTKTTALDDKQRELDSIRDKLHTKTSALDDKQRELDSIRDKLLTKTSALDDKQRELDSIRGEFEKLEAQAAQAKESVQSVKNILNAYEPVLAALKNCPLFSEYVNEHDLTAGDSKALFHLARTMGETSDFASEIHSIAVEAKKNSKEPLTAAEGKVYKAISRCYAEIWNIDFDIFICPGEQSTDKPYTTTNFNRSDMINLLDPRDKVSKYAQEVYVPLLRTKNRGLISQARVKAGNDMK